MGPQTHPADGNCAFVVTSREKAKALSADPGIEIQVVSYGFSRAKKGYMAMAVVPAVKMALDRAAISIKGCQSRQDPQPLCGQRPVPGKRDGDRLERFQQLWLLHDLRTPPRADRRPMHYGRNRGGGHAGRWVSPVGWLCGRGYGRRHGAEDWVISHRLGLTDLTDSGKRGCCGSTQQPLFVS